MKKTLVIAALLLAGFSSQTYAGGDRVKGNGKVIKVERNLESFSKIATGGSIDIVIGQNGKESAVVETDENLQDYIVTEVENGTLRIHVRERVRISSTKLTVYVHCKNLEAISSGGSGDFMTSAPIRSDHFAISHGGSGDFNLSLEVKKLNISTAGSGDYKLQGNAGSMDLSMSGSGDVDARGLECEQAKISMAGSGDVHLRKNTSAKVSSAGSGDVTYD